MKRADKIAAVERMHEDFAQSPHMIIAGFRGLNVNQSTALRSKVRAAGGRYQVVKNRLAKLAAPGTAMENLVDHLGGPCAVASHATDPVGLAKVIAEFAKDHPAVEMIAGVVDARDVLDAADVKRLSKMPGMPELRAQLLSLVNTPATMLVRLIGTPAESVARVIDARQGSLGDEDAN